MVRLYEGQRWVVLRSFSARTAHPYDSEVRENGLINHPSLDLVASPDLVDRVPEIAEFPGLRAVLCAANHPEGEVRSTQCAPGLVQRSDGKISAGAVVNLALLHDTANLDPSNLIDLAARIAQALGPLDESLGVRLIVEPYRSWQGQDGYWSVALEFAGIGDDKQSAWAAAHRCADLVAEAIRTAAKQPKTIGAVANSGEWLARR